MDIKHVWTTPNAEELVAYIARVSNPDNQDNKATAAKLIKYLITNKHWSPLDMVDTCIEITTTRDIARQVLRHRSFSFQEFSQRYAKVAAVGVIPELRLQDHANRQNSIEVTDEKQKDELYWLNEEIAEHFNDAIELYESLLQAGVAKECAREVLPLATPTRLYMNGTIRSWLHYCQLRCANGTQKEHQIIAREVYKLLEEHVPNVCVSLGIE